MVEVYCTNEYNAIMLKRLKFVASPPRHYFMRLIMELMLGTLDVNGAAIEASELERDSPTSACFKAPQSLAPSPHMPTIFPVD